MKLAEWTRNFQLKYRDYLEQLAECGEWEAQVDFDTNGYIGKNGDVEVTTEMRLQDGGFTIRATGEAVGFIEFGTGVLAGAIRNGIQADYEIRPGSWSEGHERMFSRFGYWYYDGQRLDSTAPASAMQNACSVMEQQSLEIARRVFG